MEEYMEYELSGIFRVKLVTKNIVRGSPGTQFMHRGLITYASGSNWDICALVYDFYNLWFNLAILPSLLLILL